MYVGANATRNYCACDITSTGGYCGATCTQTCECLQASGRNSGGLWLMRGEAPLAAQRDSQREWPARGVSGAAPQ
jgi:hypothetical protein